MTSGNFWDYEIWSFIVTVTVLMGAMMVANILRRKVSFIGKSLIPSSVLGGFLVLILSFFYTKITNRPLIATETLEALTYHGLGLGFVAMTLVNTEKQKDKNRQRDILNTGVTTVATYLLQAVVGLIVSIGLFYVIEASILRVFFSLSATVRDRDRRITGAATTKRFTALKTALLSDLPLRQWDLSQRRSAELFISTL